MKRLPEAHGQALLRTTSQSHFVRQGQVAAPSVCFAAARIPLAAAPTAPPCFRRWRRSSPLPLVGEPLAKRRGFTVCQGLSYKERWHCAAMTERLDKGEATHERKTQKNRHLTVTVRLSVQFIMTHSQTHPLRPFAGRRWRWCRGPRGRRPSRRQGCPPPLSQSCP